MEVYTENESVVDVLAPQPCDNSIELDTLVKCIGVRAKSYVHTSINKYIFSYGLSWLTVCPRRSDYAVIGRLFPREHFRVLKSTVDYDYLYRGTLIQCVSIFSSLVSECLRYNFELC